MGKEHNKDLLKFLSSFPDDVKDRALWLRNLSGTSIRKPTS